MQRFFLLFSIVSFFVSCNQSEEPRVIKGEIFGSTYNIQYYGNENLKPEVESLLNEFDSLFSTYRQDSEISRLNASKQGITVSEKFIELFLFCKRQNQNTNGYFDPSLEPLVNHYGFGWKRSEEFKEFDSARLAAGFNKFYLKGDSILKKHPKASMNINAITGYANDWVADLFNKKGIENYLIEIGGEITAKGTKPNKENWLVGIDDPIAALKDERKLELKIKLENVGLATSGNYRKYKTDSTGRRTVHTINPQTGEAFEGELISASVIIPFDNSLATATADATATALMAMGEKKLSEQFLNQNPEISAFVIYQNQEGQLEKKFYNGFEAIVQE